MLNTYSVYILTRMQDNQDSKPSFKPAFPLFPTYSMIDLKSVTECMSLLPGSG